ncbi:MAG: cycloartenol synthase [Spartobacteria bacterium]|nr:cycloartenol synthase [Spartobacteria bacterium]
MRTIITVCLMIGMTCVAGFGQEIEIAMETEIVPSVDPSLANEARAAIQRGLQWLVDTQQPNGHWSNEYFPALTALPLWALSAANSSASNSMDKAVIFILTCARDNGAIYRDPPEQRKGGGLSTYNTALCMIALDAVRNPALTPVVLRAREFIARTQHLGGDVYHGGMGYDESTGRPYADLSNTYTAYEAMRLTEGAEDARPEGEEKADLDWQAAQEFLARVQNDAQVNDASWVADDPDNKGGFVYRPDENKAPSFTDEEGVVRFRSYGSMTYAGLLSLIYADVSPDDPRVTSAFNWATQHWTLEENPGMGTEGLFYFYNVLSKALHVFGRDEFKGTTGETINWRNALIKKLVGLQKIDPRTGNGYWVNEENRWWEADPVLVTSYSLLALQAALQ